MSDYEMNDAEAIIEAARLTADPFAIDPTKRSIHAFLVPENAKLERVEVDDRYLLTPERLTGAVRVDAVESFTAYVAEFYDPKTTTAWVNPSEHRIIAVLNDAQRDTPQWRDHRATLQLHLTPEWKRWRAKDGRLMGQVEFAEHIEESELDIVTPDAAELLEIAQTFHASTKAEFKSGTRLKTGEVAFQWVEETNATAGRKGDLTIPDKFELLISPFEGEDRCALTALLRYRVREGALSIGYKLVRPDDVIRAAIDLLAENLKETIDRVYLGSPAS